MKIMVRYRALQGSNAIGQENVTQTLMETWNTHDGVDEVKRQTNRACLSIV